VLSAPAFLTQLLPSHRKRVCAGCLRAGRARLSLACSGCRVLHYCSTTCRAQHAAGLVCVSGQQNVEQRLTAAVNQPHADTASSPPASSSAPAPATAAQPGIAASTINTPSISPVPHALLCPVYAQFSSFKLDGDMQAMLLMVLEAWTRGNSWGEPHQQQQQQQQLTADAVTSQLAVMTTGCTATSDIPGGCSKPQSEPGLTHFLALCSHMDRLPARDQAEWRKGAAFLVKAMRKAGGTCPPPVPDEEVVVHMCGRILANSFGLWALPPLEEQQPQQPPVDGDAPTAGVPSPPPCVAQAGTQHLPACSPAGTEHQPSAQQQAVTSTAAGTGAQQGGRECSRRSKRAARASSGPLVGRQVFLPLSLANHSCDPSCWVDCGGGGEEGQRQGVSTARIIAGRPLAPGDEITISYIGLDAPCSSRRASLLAQYSFLCSCSRCKEELVRGSTKVSWAGSASKQGHSSTQGSRHRGGQQQGGGCARKGGGKTSKGQSRASKPKQTNTDGRAE
jgi:hypothetical protein